jgi:hypothetical protein
MSDFLNVMKETEYNYWKNNIKIKTTYYKKMEIGFIFK